jgi:hypothetical protein
MHSLQVIKSIDVNNFVFNLWKTKEFKQEHMNPESFLQTYLKTMGQHPRFFCQMSDIHTERAHFTPWFNIITLRDYENNYIHDLYLLHEIIHLTTLKYKNESWTLWRQKMFDNEMITSLITEVEIYKLIPSIRLKSFNHPIWADEISYSSFEELISLRQKAILLPQSESEEQISKYSKNNELWAEIWEKSFSLVEAHMLNFYNKKSEEDKISTHLNWIKQHSSNNIIFEHEARLFAPIYWAK